MNTPTVEKRVIPFGRPWITETEKQAVLQVLEGDVLTHGPQSKAFEEEFSAFVGDGAYCVSVSSGMAALHLAYFQMNLNPGDEVIVPALTHTATAHAVEVMGLKPVFVDCHLDSGNIDAQKIEKAVTSKTKVISLVHFLGIPCDMDAVMDVARRRNLKVVEDCALAIGTRYKKKHAGLFGEAGCFSFYPVKHITTGEGGMFITSHQDVKERVNKARAFGVDRSFAERSIPGMYDVLSLGLNYRMSDINASIGRMQIKKLGEILSRRKNNFNRLKSALQKIEGVLILDASSPDMENSHYCLSVVLQKDLIGKRDSAVNKLKAAGVGTSVYYPQPVPAMTYYRKKYGYDINQFPNASMISNQSIALPVGPHLSPQDIDYISETFVNVIKEVRQ